MNLSLLFLPLVGIIVGFFSGLLGLGGGAVIVPCLLFVFPLLGIAASTHLAIGTSMSIVLITLSASLYFHLKNVNPHPLWKLAVKFVPGIIVGTILGSLIAKQLSNEHLKIVFGIILWLLALRVIFVKDAAVSQGNEIFGALPNIMILTMLTIIMGTLSGLMGVGGGIFLISYLGTRGFSMQVAGTLAPMVAIPVGVVGTISYIMTGQGAPNLPAWSTGYVYWPATLGICLTGVITAHYSAKLAHKIPSKLLRYCFLFYLVAIGAKMIFFK